MPLEKEMIFRYIVEKSFNLSTAMVTQYFTLAALCRELDVRLRDKRIEEVFTQQKDELILALDGEQSLIISVSPALNYCFVRDQYCRAKKNSVDLFQSLIGAVISEVGISPQDRMISVRTNYSLTLQLLLYNTAASNILLLHENGTVVEAFKRNKELQGTIVQETVRVEKTDFSEKTLQKEFQQFSTSSVAFALKKIFPLFGSVLIREILSRSGIEENIRVEELKRNDYEEISHHGRVILESVTFPQATIYYKHGEPNTLSIIPLHHLGGEESKTFPTVNEAVQKFIAQRFHTQKREDVKKTLLEKLKTLSEQTQRSLEKAAAVSSEVNRAEEYERIGNTIMANLQHLTKGMNEIELQNLYSPEENIRIKLDPKLTPAQNAQAYYEKARKARLALQESEQRRKELRERCSLLERMSQHLEQCRTQEEVTDFTDRFRKELQALKITSGTTEKAPLPFRVFTVFGGYEVWVGKNSSSNDELTTKYAKPNDFWFHVRGAGGSHVVLKVKSKKQPPPKEAITQAARIAAYYSKMRKASHVPVAYCERKYVHKRKGMPQGTVFLEREEVLFVEPALP
jgi:predicted ribosome quality control (RQC) complex YloA/Tae2 family protein